MPGWFLVNSHLCIPHREVVDSSPSTNSTNGSGDKSKPLLLAPPSPSSDVDKPVKVKSRWRRTSELEQVVTPRPHALLEGELLFIRPLLPYRGIFLNTFIYVFDKIVKILCRRGNFCEGDFPFLQEVFYIL